MAYRRRRSYGARSSRSKSYRRRYRSYRRPARATSYRRRYTGGMKRRTYARKTTRTFNFAGVIYPKIGYAMLVSRVDPSVYFTVPMSQLAQVASTQANATALAAAFVITLGNPVAYAEYLRTRKRTNRVPTRPVGSDDIQVD